MRLHHPRSLQDTNPPTYVSLGPRHRAPVAADGTVDLTDANAERALACWTDRYNVSREALLADSDDAADGADDEELDAMKHGELKDLYFALGGDPDAVNLATSASVIEGIRRLQD
jgi:hypothetical protein